MQRNANGHGLTGSSATFPVQDPNSESLAPRTVRLETLAGTLRGLLGDVDIAEDRLFEREQPTLLRGPFTRGRETRRLEVRRQAALTLAEV